RIPAGQRLAVAGARAAGRTGPRRAGARAPLLRLLARRGALQVRVRARARGGARRDDRGPGMSLRVALLSAPTCPVAVPGGKETGGMNVYVRELARELGRMGVCADVFTRSQNADIPRVVNITEGVRVVHLTAGPEAPIPRERIRDHLEEFVDGI